MALLVSRGLFSRHISVTWRVFCVFWRDFWRGFGGIFAGPLRGRISCYSHIHLLKSAVNPHSIACDRAKRLIYQAHHLRKGYCLTLKPWGRSAPSLYLPGAPSQEKPHPPTLYSVAYGIFEIPPDPPGGENTRRHSCCSPRKNRTSRSFFLSSGIFLVVPCTI